MPGRRKPGGGPGRRRQDKAASMPASMFQEPRVHAKNESFIRAELTLVVVVFSVG